MPSKRLVSQIVPLVAARFRSFGGGRADSFWGNPLVAIRRDQPAQFAAGVNIADVVSYILKEQAKARRRSMAKRVRVERNALDACGARHQKSY